MKNRPTPRREKSSIERSRPPGEDPSDPGRSPAALRKRPGGRGRRVVPRRSGRVRDRDRLRPGRAWRPIPPPLTGFTTPKDGPPSIRSSFTWKESPRRGSALPFGPKAADRLAGTFWPGPLTLVLNRSSLIPDVVTGGRETVALRVPLPPVARGLIERVGQPLAAPSANRSNRLSPTRAEHVLCRPGRQDRPDPRQRAHLPRPGVDGPRPDRLPLAHPSTWPDRTGRDRPVPGSASTRLPITREDVARPPGELPASPGTLDVHYAPRTPALRVDSVEDLAKISWPEKSALLVLGPAALPDLPDALHLVELPEPEAAGHRLYGVLHECDALNLNVIVIVMPPDQPEWRTIRDRLVRAARPVTG